MKFPKTIISLLAIMLITTMVAFISSAKKKRGSAERPRPHDAKCGKRQL